MNQCRKKHNDSHQNRISAAGFTLLEIIISAGILVLIAALTAAAFSSFYKTLALNAAAENGLVMLQQARSNTLSSKDSSEYGVHFESSRIVFFKGAAFSEPNPDNEEYKLSSFVEIYGISLNGAGSDVVFQKLTGKTGQYGVISLRLKSDISKTKTITINSNGSASY